MKRNDIPSDIAAKVLFQSDRTCCVCRIKGKPVQIHHIDGDRSNHEISNLAILCFDCHTNTQISGGFHRKLDAEQVILYRNDWVSLVARERATAFLESEKPSSSPNLELITTTLEVLKENKEYALLAMHYDILGNVELRDKCIEMALKQEKSTEAETFFRAMQGKIGLVDQRKIRKEINRLTKNEDWSQLARLYIRIKDWDNAIQCYCRSICEDLESGNTFAAAFYLKELASEKIHDPLFGKAYREFSEQGDLWWQVRSLQELGWHSELEELLISKRTEIEKSDDLHLLELLYRATGEKEKLLEITKKLASLGW